MDTSVPNGAFDPAMLLTLLIIVLGLLAVLNRRMNAANPPLPPGPRGMPFLGYLPLPGKHLHREFAELEKAYGHTYKLWLGNNLWAVLTTPSAIMMLWPLLATRGATIALSTLSRCRKDITFTDYGPYWRKMRKAFVREIVQGEREWKKCINSSYNTAGSLVDVGQLSLLLLIDVIMALLWGHNVKGENRETLSLECRKAAAEMMVPLGKANISDLFPVLATFDVQGVEREAKRTTQRRDNFLDSATSGATRRNTDKPNRKEDEARDGGKKKHLLQILINLQIEEEENSPTSTTKNQETEGILSVNLSYFLGRVLKLYKHLKQISKHATGERIFNV